MESFPINLVMSGSMGACHDSSPAHASHAMKGYRAVFAQGFFALLQELIDNRLGGDVTVREREMVHSNALSHERLLVFVLILALIVVVEPCDLEDFAA